MNAQRFRLPSGGRVDRSRPVSFRFNGKHYAGYAGDTLASALLANGVSMVARSWKYHRPRGIVSAGVEEPNALVQLEEGRYTVPNARMTETPLYEGLVAHSVNAWPSLDWDLLSINSLFARLMPAGFYYKTFMWPKSFWMKYEHFIRKASGLGRAPEHVDPDTYDKTNAHCDVLVVGGGPSGLAAALAAGRTGARVILADNGEEFGGLLLDLARARIDGRPGAEWVANAVAELSRMPDVTLLPRSTVFGYHDQNYLTIAQRLTDHLPVASRRGRRERVWRVRAKRVVLAAGAFERPLVFGNNDLPGIMLASAASTYCNRYGVQPGSRAVLFTNNDGAYETALDLRAAGIPVVAVDVRHAPVGPGVEAAAAVGIEIIRGSVITEAHGGRRVDSVRVASVDEPGERITGGVREIRCDLVATSGGWSPAVHLHAQSGARPRFDDARACFVPGTALQAERSVGACNGAFQLAECLSDGFAAGAEAAVLAGRAGHAGSPPQSGASEGLASSLQPLWLVPGEHPPGRGPKQFVDLQNDVAAADILLAVREGFHSIEHVKRYTALGFGTDQGKLGNINGMGIVAQALGQDMASTGTTTFRPNFTPVTFGAIAGREMGDLLDPIRQTPMHDWNVSRGAPFENVGQWKRAWYYPKPGEDLHAAVNRECLAVRNGVGIFDGSTLGKIDVRGPDAATLLEWVYSNNWKSLGVGRCRYGLMLDENGMVMDDGVTSRLADDHFFMTTTTGGAARVFAWMEKWLQTEWPHLKVHLTSVTDHYATIALAGPKSRDVLKAVCPDIDFGKDAFPFMSFRDGTVAGVEARVMRISFSGELAYEVYVRADCGQHVWSALMAAGEPYDITPYGTETMHVLRAEKGFIIVGQETDGSVTPIDLGMGGLVAKNRDFLGKRSLFRSDTARENRKQLVGLLAEDPFAVLPEGGQIVVNGRVPPPVPMLGHVTSSYWSACLNRSIALALVKDGRRRMGEKVEVPLADGRILRAEIVKPVFWDEEGARQHV